MKRGQETASPGFQWCKRIYHLKDSPSINYTGCLGDHRMDRAKETQIGICSKGNKENKPLRREEEIPAAFSVDPLGWEMEPFVHTLQTVCPESPTGGCGSGVAHPCCVQAAPALLLRLHHRGSAPAVLHCQGNPPAATSVQLLCPCWGETR